MKLRLMEALSAFLSFSLLAVALPSWGMGQPHATLVAAAFAALSWWMMRSLGGKR
jgi:hypothetical protein